MIVTEKKKAIKGPGDVPAIVRAVLAKEDEIDNMKEHFWVFGLNTRHVIQYIELVSLGTLTEASIRPREVFRFAIQKAVASIILAHNHPSDDPAPSKADVKMTTRLVAGGEILVIKVLDHVIVGNNFGYYSFKEEGNVI